MYTLFLDESIQRKRDIFGLGGILLENVNFRDIEDKFNTLKSRMGLTPSHPLKWNLSDEKQEYRETKKILEKKNINRFKCRNRVLKLISSFECYIFACLLEETRANFSIEIQGKKILKIPKKLNIRDFYPWAFKFLLQRMYFFLKDKQLSGDRMSIIIDRPSFPKRIRETLLHEIYQDAYNNGFQFPRNTIPPLKEYLQETLAFSYTDQSSFLQLADFCIGASVNYGQAKIERRNRGAEKLFKMISEKFYTDPNTGQINGYGFIIYPPQETLLGMVEETLK